MSPLGSDLLVAIARPAVFGAVAPLFAWGLPWTARLAIGATLALALLPAALAGVAAASAASAAFAAGPAGLGAAVLTEVAVGVALAICAGAGAWAGAAGARLSLGATGLGDAALGIAEPLADAVAVLAVATLLAAGAHGPVLRLLAASFATVPPGTPLAGLAEAAVQGGAGAIGLSAAIAAPAFGATMATHVCWAVAARVGGGATGALARAASLPTGLAAAVAALGAVGASGALEAGWRRAVDVGVAAFRSAVAWP